MSASRADVAMLLMLVAAIAAIQVAQATWPHYYDSYEGPMAADPPAYYDVVEMSSSHDCPEVCTCPLAWPTAMYCDNRKLKEVPPVPSRMKYIYLSGNQIEGIKDDAFSNATELSWLLVDNNQLLSDKVGKGVFSKMGSLEKLYLDHNNLTALPTLPRSLHELRASHNKLSKFGGSLGKLENLTMLIMNNNKLKEDGLGAAFKGLKSLIQLDLSGNQLKKIPDSLPASIKMLYLDNNNIDAVPADFVNKFAGLQYLRLSHNAMTDAGVPAAVFNSTSLVELGLGHNKLHKIPVVSEHLENLYLEANEIQEFTVSSFCGSPGSPLAYSRLRYLRMDGNNLTRSALPAEAFQCLRVASEILF